MIPVSLQTIRLLHWLTKLLAFPPRQDEDPKHDEIAIQDPWIGPATYAEDFYSNGDRPLFKGNDHQPDTLGEDQDSPDPSPYITHEDDEGMC